MLASCRCSNRIRRSFALAACPLSCNVVAAGNLLLSDGRDSPANSGRIAPEPTLNGSTDARPPPTVPFHKQR